VCLLDNPLTNRFQYIWSIRCQFSTIFDGIKKVKQIILTVRRCLLASVNNGIELFRQAGGEIMALALCSGL